MIKKAINFLQNSGYKVYSDAKREDWIKQKRSRWIKRGKFNHSKRGLINPKNKDSYFRVWRGEYFWGIMNTREVISLYRSIKKDHGAAAKFAKSHNGQERSAIRDRIRGEEFDKIPKSGNINKVTISDYY